MATSTKGWSVADFIKAGGKQGLRTPPLNDQFASVYPLIAKGAQPPKTSADWPVLAEACLACRGLIYWKNSPGDCPQQNPLDTSQLQELKLGSAAGSGAASAIGAAGLISGAATAGIGLGISLGVSVISDILEHHAQAVQTEQQDICQAAQVFNQSLAYIDSEVAAGTVSSGDGVKLVQQLCSQVSAYLDTIKKTCNAACVYEGVLVAHQNFVVQYYPYISPDGSVQLIPPQGAPLAYGGAPSQPFATSGNRPIPAPNSNAGASNPSPASNKATSQPAPVLDNDAALEQPQFQSVPAAQTSVSHEVFVLGIIVALIILVLVK